MIKEIRFPTTLVGQQMPIEEIRSDLAGFSDLIVKGTKINSRHGKPSEIIEMIKFAELAYKENILHYIEEIFYDSVSCICTFKFGDTAQKCFTLDHYIIKKIQEIATKTLSQYELFDEVFNSEQPYIEVPEGDRKEECIKELKELMNAESITILSKDHDGGIHVTFRGKNISASEAIQMYAFGIHLTYKDFLKKK